MADDNEFGWMAWPSHLRPIPFDVERLGFDPNANPNRAGERIRDLENATLTNDVEENKLIAVVWHTRSFIDVAGTKKKATWAGLHSYFWDEYRKDIRPPHLRLRVMIVDVFIPFGVEAEQWIEEFQFSVAGRLAELTRLVFKKMFDGKQTALQMTDEEMEFATPVVKRIMRHCLPGDTAYRDVQRKFVNEMKLLDLDDVEGPSGGPGPKTPFDIDAEIIKRIRNSRDGMIGPADEPIFVLEDGPAINPRFEQADRDWVMDYCKEHNITRGVLRRRMLDYFKAHHMKTGEGEGEAA